MSTEPNTIDVDLDLRWHDGEPVNLFPNDYQVLNDLAAEKGVAVKDLDPQEAIVAIQMARYDHDDDESESLYEGASCIIADTDHDPADPTNKWHRFDFMGGGDDDGPAPARINVNKYRTQPWQVEIYVGSDTDMTVEDARLVARALHLAIEKADEMNAKDAQNA